MLDRRQTQTFKTPRTRLAYRPGRAASPRSASLPSPSLNTRGHRKAILGRAPLSHGTAELSLSSHDQHPGRKAQRHPEKPAPFDLRRVLIACPGEPERSSPKKQQERPPAALMLAPVIWIGRERNEPRSVTRLDLDYFLTTGAAGA